MGQLVEEVKLWNTPTNGAYLLWRFTKGYCDGHPKGDAPIGLLFFLASAIITNKELSKSISNKRSGLQSFARGFEDSKASDLLLSIQGRVYEKKEYTLKAIDIAISKGLLVWDADSGKIYHKEYLGRVKRGSSLKEGIKKEGNKAEILGKWFSEHNISSIASYLKVVF